MCRLTLKPLMSGNMSVESLRRTAALLDRGMTASLSPGVQIEQVEFDAFTAEWLTVPDCNPRRVMLFLPGGGYVTHTPLSQRRSLAARICGEARARSLLVNYRLAPEDPFPAGLHDCLSAYRYLLGHGIRPEHIVIGGESTGGGMALSTLLMLRDEGLPLPAGAFCISPVTDLSDIVTGSREENRWADPAVSFALAKELFGLYLNNRIDLMSHPHVSPVYGDYRGMPPLLFQVGSTEILRDDSIKVAEQARAAGVWVEVEIWERMPHVWHLVPFLPETRRAVARLGEFIRRCTLELNLG